MISGGLSLVKKTIGIMRIIGLTAPLVLFGYGLLIENGSVASTSYHGFAVLCTLMVLWLTVAIIQYIWPGSTYRRVFTYLSLYFVFILLYVVLVAGFSGPLQIGWVVIYVVAYLYYSKRGAAIAMLWGLVTVCADAQVNHLSFSNYFLLILSYLASLLAGIATISLITIREDVKDKLNKSQQQENLQRDRMVTLINNLADAIISTDKRGIIRLYNAATLGLIDTNVSLNGQPVDSVLKLETAEGKRVKLMTLLRHAEAVTVDDSLRLPLGDDDHIRLEITYAPIRSGYAAQSESDGGYVIIVRDITKAKSLEEERDEFISVVSHELRTPIAITEGTISNAQLMLEKTKDITKVGESLHMAHDQTLFLAKMVNDLSTLSRAERGVADTAELIDVKELAQSLYNEYAPEATKKNLRLNLDISPRLGHVTASPLYLHELLQNFITNSIKYTKEGHIDLIVRRVGDTIHFEVKDTGIGISKTDQTKVFQKFYRAEDYRTRETSGTGLGLYVVSKLAHKLGCKIELKSRLNHGSSFSFELPIAQEAK